MKVTFLIVVLGLSAQAEDPLCAGLPADKEILFPSPVDCKIYYKCYQGNFSEEMCPKDLYFSEYNKGCVEAQYSECMGGTGTPPVSTSSSSIPTTTNTTTTTTTTTSTTTTSPTTTTTPTPTTTTTTPDPVDPRCVDNTTSYWPHPTECHLYVECFEGRSYEMSCPPSTYFSDQQKRCVIASQSECCQNDASKCK